VTKITITGLEQFSWAYAAPTVVLFWGLLCFFGRIHFLSFITWSVVCPCEYGQGVKLFIVRL